MTFPFTVSGSSNGKAATTANEKNDGGDRRKWMGIVEMTMGFLVIMVL